METFFTNPDGSIPSDPQAYYAGQNASVGVNPTTRRLLVETIESVTPPTTAATLAGTTKTVAAAGTPEALGTGTCHEVFIFPLRTNTGVVYWGTEATNDTQNGTLPVVITAPDGKVLDLANIFIDVTVNGEGVRFIKSS